MIRILITAVFLIQVSIFTNTALADTQEAVKLAAQEILDTQFTDTTPGVAILVAQGDDILFRGARGLASVELGIPLSPDHVFRIASLSKQFASVALLKLVDDGKVALDDPLSKFLPDYPNGDAITVAQLLNHTSGIKSYTGIAEYFVEHIRADRTTAQMIEVFKDLPTDFTPGEKYAYNNSGYILVGAVIEAATDRDWYEYMRTEMLLPNGIKQTQYGDDDVIIPGYVNGYTLNDDKIVSPAFYLSMTQPHAAGAVVSTVNDLLKWNRALHEGKVLSVQTYERMITPEGAAAEKDYGYGVGVRDIGGHKMIAHSGGIPGFSTYLLYIPGKDVTAVVLQNTDNGSQDSGEIAIELAKVALSIPADK